MTPNPGRVVDASRTGQMLNKVPEITIYFWVIKVHATTVGETAADILNNTLAWGLNGPASSWPAC
jgi:uncharacterized membrane-anchored protein